MNWRNKLLSSKCTGPLVLLKYSVIWSLYVDDSIRAIIGIHAMWQVYLLIAICQ